jgi:hypothetical protein
MALQYDPSRPWIGGGFGHPDLGHETVAPPGTAMNRFSPGLPRALRSADTFWARLASSTKVSGQRVVISLWLKRSRFHQDQQRVQNLGGDGRFAPRSSTPYESSRHGPIRRGAAAEHAAKVTKFRSL